jgi:hypothetical protein
MIRVLRSTRTLRWLSRQRRRILPTLDILRPLRPSAAGGQVKALIINRTLQPTPSSRPHLQ